MYFVSTQKRTDSVGFTEALFRGLAPDGGLYHPETTPDLSALFTSLGSEMNFRELSIEICSSLFEPEIDRKTIHDIVHEAFHFEPVLREIYDGMTVMELFHGPTCAFKDFGASFLASAMNRLLAGRDKRAIIVTATSGDTGSAVAQAFHGKERIDVVILYPSGRVSPLQEKQLTTLGGNVTALEVNGSFDDCQRMAKAAFTDPKLVELPLSSANSINLGRLIPQSFYYIWAWTRMRGLGRNEFAFVVPSGNFGNITAGLYAATWGMPVNRFVAATNANDVIPEFLRTGNYTPRASVATLSNAMDVGSPSNYERLDRLYKQDVGVFRRHVEAWSVDDETTLEVIARVHRDYNYLCCPHTAVGWHVAEHYRKRHSGGATLVLSTAHPGKFVEVVERATGEKPSLPPELAALSNRTKVAVSMGNADHNLAGWLLERFG